MTVSPACTLDRLTVVSRLSLVARTIALANSAAVGSRPPARRRVATASGSRRSNNRTMRFRRSCRRTPVCPASKPSTVTDICVELLQFGAPQFPRLGQHHEHTKPLAALAAFFDRLGRYKAAATIAGFALSP